MIRRFWCFGLFFLVTAAVMMSSTLTTSSITKAELPSKKLSGQHVNILRLLRTAQKPSVKPLKHLARLLLELLKLQLKFRVSTTACK